jgi:hypothetical protein
VFFKRESAKMRKLFVLAVVFLGLSDIASAKARCGPWVPQVNGTEWRMCWDAQGNRYCELRRRYDEIVPMRCP